LSTESESFLLDHCAAIALHDGLISVLVVPVSRRDVVLVTGGKGSINLTKLTQHQ